MLLWPVRLLTKKKMKIYHISDTHVFHSKVEIPNEKFDLIVHSGDAANSRSIIKNETELRSFFSWYDSLEVDCPKIYVPGNHDRCLEVNPYLFKTDYKNIKFLIHEMWEYQGYKIFGFPYTPEFLNWYFSYNRNDSTRIDQIPEDIDILISHGPPLGISDRTRDYHDETKTISVGCEMLLNKINNSSIKACLFGHIHEEYEMYNYGVYLMHKKIFSNAALYAHKMNTFFTKGNIVEV